MKDNFPQPEKGSLKQRMAARAKLSDPSQPPRFVFSCAEKDANGEWLDSNPRYAICGDRKLERGEREGVEEFTERAAKEFFSVNESGWPFVFLTRTPELPPAPSLPSEEMK